jgi:hypothetical protein
MIVGYTLIKFLYFGAQYYEQHMRESYQYIFLMDNNKVNFDYLVAFCFVHLCFCAISFSFIQEIYIKVL